MEVTDGGPPLLVAADASPITLMAGRPVFCRRRQENRGYIEFGLLFRANFAMSNIEGALAKNQTAIMASVMAHPAEEFERNGIIGAP